MKVDIPTLVQSACNDLTELKRKIDASDISEDDLKKLIQKIQKEANDLTREVSKSSTLPVLDLSNLINLLTAIKNSSTQLGHQQALFLGVFHRMENCIKKFESKVTKVDTDLLS